MCICIYIGGLMGYIYIYPKKLQFAAYGQFVLVILAVPLLNGYIITWVLTKAAHK